MWSFFVVVVCLVLFSLVSAAFLANKDVYYKMMASDCPSVCLSVSCLELENGKAWKPKIGRMVAHHTGNQ